MVKFRPVPDLTACRPSLRPPYGSLLIDNLKFLSKIANSIFSTSNANVKIEGFTPRMLKITNVSNGPYGFTGKIPPATPPACTAPKSDVGGLPVQGSRFEVQGSKFDVPASRLAPRAVRNVTACHDLSRVMSRVENHKTPVPIELSRCHGCTPLRATPRAGKIPGTAVGPAIYRVLNLFKLF